MTKVLLIRHGKTYGNIKNVFTGQIEVEMLPQGYEQAEAVGEYLAENEQVAAIFSSDAKRVRETAQPLASRLGLPIQLEPALREIYSPKWDGRDYKDLFESDPNYRDWKLDRWNCRATDGESTKEVFERSYQAICRFAAENPEKTIAVFTHYTPIHMIVRKLTGLDTPDFKIPNASVTTLCFRDGECSVERLGYHGHLDEINQKYEEILK